MNGDSEAAPCRGRVVLVRHGESEGNRSRTFTASSDNPLTDLGREQAREAALAIARRYAPTRIVSSPFARARETATLIAAALALPVEIDEVWREQSLGRLAGEPYDSVLSDPTFDANQPWLWRAPQGESLTDVQRRVAPAFDRLVSVTESEIVLVSHSGVMRALCAHIAGSWTTVPRVHNAGIIVVELIPGGCRLAPHDT